MSTRIAIIGGGPGGYVAAIRAAALGGDVTLIEKNDLGGTCLNQGCIPSKIMKHSAELLLKIQKADKAGIKIEGSVTPDMPGLMKKKEKILQTQKKGIASLLQNNNVKIENAKAKIKASEKCEAGQLEMLFPDGSLKELTYDRLIIAGGTKPLELPDLPFDGQNILSSNDLLQLDKVPKSIVIVGGGVIGCEFAFILSALGADVTIVEAMSRLLPLPSVDEECSKLLQKEMKKRKITVLCDTVACSSETQADGQDIHLAISPCTDNPFPKKPKKDRIKAEKLAICIGRTPLSKDLGLENIQLDTISCGWLQVNNKMETKIKNVYAIGDILGPEKVMLAHAASHEGIIAAQNAMNQNAGMNYEVIPSAIFTMPEIGTVGLSEAEAVKKGMEVKSFSTNFRILGKAHAIDEIAGFAKMIIEKGTDKILGVHIIGPHATDLIAEAALAINKGLSTEDIAHTIHAHPTLAEIMQELALKACGTPIHS